MSSYKKEMDTLVGEILGSYREYPQTCSINTTHRLNNAIIIDLLDKIRSVVFPGFFEKRHLIKALSSIISESCWRISSTV